MTMADSEPTDIIYVSWGGTGRGAALRRAHAIAAERGHNLVYLAILDSPTFSDLESGLLRVVTEELHWMLEAQLGLVEQESGTADVQTRIVVRDGDVIGQVADLVQVTGADMVLVGAPVPLLQHTTIDELVHTLQDRTSVVVELIT